MPEREVRPRFGTVKPVGGKERAISFRPVSDDPMAFEAVDPITDEVVELNKGDVLKVDVIGPGQSIVVARYGKGVPATTAHEWRSKKDTELMEEIFPTKEKKEKDMDENKTPRHAKNQDPNAVWKGLAGLAGFAAIVVLTIAGVRWALSL